jgi:hypothetical protein
MRLLKLTFLFLLLRFEAAIGQTATVDTLLELKSLGLSSIPDSVFEKTGLLSLDLGVTGMTVYPPMSAMPDNPNQLTELPAKISKLRKLHALNISFNQIKSLPSSVTKLTELISLNLSFNKDLDVLSQLDKIKQLRKLKILNIIGTKNVLDNLALIKKELRSDIKIYATLNDYN